MKKSNVWWQIHPKMLKKEPISSFHHGPFRDGKSSPITLVPSRAAFTVHLQCKLSAFVSENIAYTFFLTAFRLLRQPKLTMTFFFSCSLICDRWFSFRANWHASSLIHCKIFKPRKLGFTCWMLQCWHQYSPYPIKRFCMWWFIRIWRQN